MLRQFLFVFLFVGVFNLSASAQDDYHVDLEEFLLAEYNVENGDYLFHDSEAQNANDFLTYGGMWVQTETAVGEAFETYQSFTVNIPATNPWDAGAKAVNTSPVSQNDVVLISFWAKRLSNTSTLKVFSEHSDDFSKEYYYDLVMSNNWQRYFIAFKASRNYPTNKLASGFHMGAQAQEFLIGGYTAYNFGSQYELSQLPGDVNNVSYEGADPDAAWRDLADARINNIRKADLKVTVIDENNNLVEGAEVAIEMQEHEFGFGSAVVGCRFPGNNCFNQIYVSKIVDLDGEGHGFNVAVNENFLKWNGWEEEWVTTPDQAADAVTWLDNQGIDVRGHVLVWPGWGNMPDDMQQNSTNYEYMLERIDDRIEEMLTHPVLSELITEWDVLNEITTNRDLEYAFNNYLQYDNGRQVYQTIFEKFKEVQPDFKGYVNDYIVLSGGGFGNAVETRYKDFLNEIKDSGVEWDGIGFQCHIGAQPTSILKIQQVFDEFFQVYGKRIKITEFDIEPTLSPETQAAYMSDFLTMIYSHPAVDAFIMWGFWDGNHWKDNAPIFDIDWNIKPSGQAFIDKVFNEWWTEENSITDSSGAASFDAFRGEYKVIITKDDVSQEYDVNLNEDGEFELIFSGASDINQLDNVVFEIVPNPSENGRISISSLSQTQISSIAVFNLTGVMVKQIVNPSDLNNIQLDLSEGEYLIKIFDGKSFHVEKLLVINN